MEKDYSIITMEAKQQRIDKIIEFKNKYGEGKKGLTIEQKNARIEKILGQEVEKLIGFGKNTKQGINLFSKAKTITSLNFNTEGAIDQLPEDIMKNINNYPNEPRSESNKNKILNIIIKDDGSMEMDGIVINGKENNIKERATWGITTISDESLARMELKQKVKGELKTVSDRTMLIHEENGNLNELLEDKNINTGEDEYLQY